MAKIGHFDAETVDTNIGFEVLPPGIYTMVITNSDVKEVKNKPGSSYVWLEHTICDGPYNGRKVFNNLNLWNDNPKAVRIAESFMGQLCKACGIKQLTDTEQLHGILFKAKLDVDAKDQTRDPQNRIKEYIYDKGTGGNAAASAPVAGGVAGGSVPWANG